MGKHILLLDFSDTSCIFTKGERERGGLKRIIDKCENFKGIFQDRHKRCMWIRVGQKNQILEIEFDTMWKSSVLGP